MRGSFGSLAQLVEQRTLNPFVAGSIPARPTKTHWPAEMRAFLFSRLPIKAVVVLLADSRYRNPGAVKSGDDKLNLH